MRAVRTTTSTQPGRAAWVNRMQLDEDLPAQVPRTQRGALEAEPAYNNRGQAWPEGDRARAPEAARAVAPRGGLGAFGAEGAFEARERIERSLVASGHAGGALMAGFDGRAISAGESRFLAGLQALTRGGDKLHNKLAEYTDELTPAGAMLALGEDARQKAHTMSPEEIVRLYSTDARELARAVGSRNSGVHAAVQGFEAEAGPSPMELLARGLDAQSHAWQGLSRVARLRYPPGLLAALSIDFPQGYLPPRQSDDCVWLVNGLEIDSAFEQAIKVFCRPAYKTIAPEQFMVEDPETGIASMIQRAVCPSGVPHATTVRCNQDAGRTVPATVWSDTKHQSDPERAVKPNKEHIQVCEGSHKFATGRDLQYSPEGKRGIIIGVLKWYMQKATGGNAMHNIAGAAMHATQVRARAEEHALAAGHGRYSHDDDV